MSERSYLQFKLFEGLQGRDDKSMNSMSKEETFQRLLLAEDETATVTTTSGISTTSGTTGSSTAISREELLRLFILKLDEEANYFQVQASPEEELCDCQKCQVLYF